MNFPAPFDSDITIITPANLEQEVQSIPWCDMRNEVINSLINNSETEILYSYGFCLFPNAGRGAVCLGGDSEWFDANSFDELLDRAIVAD